MNSAQDPPANLPGPSELLEASERLAGKVHRTPLLSSRTLGSRVNAEVHLKCENLQRAGSFKIRGALNASLQARAAGDVGEGGLLTYSSGNHGQAVALSASLIGSTATIVVPEDIPPVKREAIEGYGAEVVYCGFTSVERRELAEKIAAESGAKIIPPFDHPHIIAGQGTTGLEILEDLPDCDVILVPVGGGGLLAGISIAAANTRTNVIGVEPHDANAMQLSLEAGELITLDRTPQTIADGLKPVRPGHLTLLATQRHVERIITVGDDAIRQAQRLLLERAKLFVEPSGAATTAALLEHSKDFAGKKVVIVISGGNTAPPDWP